ncbi:hypothetical protein FHW96_002290 [Novosphingobium sp. SG751A]|uniref:hypothetical protein n=1 Tax=Novosphingobium sp. SG751A TaxID=2587000 RepID=UPI00155561E5|nr:hypothetical protein [Novosphingobium sp. SG751A]NOW46132.1 hypothetical protein [Novosphingobium sp. SG751A]
MLAAGFLLGACSLLGGCLDSRGQDDVWYGYYYDDLRDNAEGAISRPYKTAQECRMAMQDYTMEAKVTSGFACARGCASARDGAIANCREVVR